MSATAATKKQKPLKRHWRTELSIICMIYVERKWCSMEDKRMNISLTEDDDNKNEEIKAVSLLELK